MSGYTVTVFTKPDCQQCRMTTAMLDKVGVSYTAVPIEDYRSLRDVLWAMRLLTMPLVVVRDDGQTAASIGGRCAAAWLDDATAYWGGFRPDSIRHWASVIQDSRGAEAAS